ncbi:MAG: hypothetical protein ABIL06_00415, partial [Pseudomonadota bacterium]
MTGADQYKLTDNQAVRNNGRELEGQTRPYWCWGSSQAKKELFLEGEVFFLLTRPLMGDPINFTNIRTDGIVSRLMNTGSSSGAPLLDIGYSIGEPGKTVTVSISLANTSGYNIAAISCDISYDISVFEGA